MHDANPNPWAAMQHQSDQDWNQEHGDPAACLMQKQQIAVKKKHSWNCMLSIWWHACAAQLSKMSNQQNTKPCKLSQSKSKEQLQHSLCSDHSEARVHAKGLFACRNRAASFLSTVAIANLFLWTFTLHHFQLRDGWRFLQLWDQPVELQSPPVSD